MQDENQKTEPNPNPNQAQTEVPTVVPSSLQTSTKTPALKERSRRRLFIIAALPILVILLAALGYLWWRGHN